MKVIVTALAVIALVGCGGSAPPPVQYATAANPVELCPADTAIRGQWYCDEATTTAMISVNSDKNYAAYSAGTYNSTLTGVSCTFTVSTIKTIYGNTTCYITTQ